VKATRAGQFGRPDPKARVNGKSLADPHRHQSKSVEGQGGHVEKANDPRPAHALATPRCGPGRSGEEVNDPEGPTNSREAAEAYGSRTSGLWLNTL